MLCSEGIFRLGNEIYTLVLVGECLLLWIFVRTPQMGCVRVEIYVLLERGYVLQHEQGISADVYSCEQRRQIGRSVHSSENAKLFGDNSGDVEAVRSTRGGRFVRE